MEVDVDGSFSYAESQSDPKSSGKGSSYMNFSGCNFHLYLVITSLYDSKENIRSFHVTILLVFR